MTTPTQRSSSRQIESIRSPSATSIRGCVEHALRELARHAVARGRAARVHDAASAVAAFETEAVVELDAELDEVADTSRSLGREDLDRARAAEATAGAKRVLGMQRRVVVLPDRGGDASLREEARGREQRPLRQDEHVALGRGAERGEEPRHASSDDDERELAIVTCLSGIPHGSFSL